MAEGARLESVFTRKGNVGSNPTLSARFGIAAKMRGRELVTIFERFPLLKIVESLDSRCRGDWLRGGTGVIIAGAHLLFLLQPRIRTTFP